MRDGIHPKYHEINIIMTDGTAFKTRSTWGKPGDTMRLDVDPKSHPAWTGGGARLNDSGGQVAKFNKRFAGLGAPASAAAPAPTSRQAEEAKKPEAKKPDEKKAKADKGEGKKPDDKKAKADKGEGKKPDDKKAKGEKKDKAEAKKE